MPPAETPGDAVSCQSSQDKRRKRSPKVPAMKEGRAISAELEQLVADYLRVRRSLGFKLEYTEPLLGQFAAYLRSVGADTVTIEHALAFATAPAGASRRWQALRLSAIRCFTRWARTLDPAIEVPPAGCCWPGPPGPRHTSTPITRSAPSSTLHADCVRRSGRPR